jgi:hypothetical protein
MVVIYGENNYKLDTKHVIDRVVVEDITVLCFLETICTGGFITSTVSEN